MDETGTRTIEMVTMGCTWVLDVSDLDDAAADAMERRWSRCVGLAATPDVLRLDDETTVIRVVEGERPQDAGAETRIVSNTDGDRLPYDLSREITRLGLTRLRGRATLLHAAALSDPTGRAVVLVAPSGGGKSTATRVLGARLGYVSDESVILLPDGRMAAHPKPPSLVIDPEERFRKQEPSPDDLGLGPTPAAPRLAALLTLGRDESVTEPVIEEVGLIDQVLAVLPETSSTWWLDDGLDRLARAVTVGGAPARLRYAEIEDCHDLVREHLERARPREVTWEHLPATGEQRREVDAPAPPTVDPAEIELVDDDRLVRAPWSDAIGCDDEVLVLAGARPLRLAGPGAVIWRAAAGPVSLVEVGERVVEALGEHPEALDLVRTAAAQLLAHGVLARA